MAPGTTKPYQPPAEPEGKINLTDPDCRLQKVRQGWVQGYNVQAVVNEQQIVLAAEITVDSPDFGHLGPMMEGPERQLANVGIEERLGAAPRKRQASRPRSAGPAARTPRPSPLRKCINGRRQPQSTTERDARADDRD